MFKGQSQSQASQSVPRNQEEPLTQIISQFTHKAISLSVNSWGSEMLFVPFPQHIKGDRKKRQWKIMEEEGMLEGNMSSFYGPEKRQVIDR
jgi:hypothetical protein